MNAATVFRLSLVPQTEPRAIQSDVPLVSRGGDEGVAAVFVISAIILRDVSEHIQRKA